MTDDYCYYLPAGSLMKVYVVMVGCTDYYCHGAHLLVGVYDSEEKAKAAPVPDRIDDNEVDKWSLGDFREIYTVTVE